MEKRPAACRPLFLCLNRYKSTSAVSKNYFKILKNSIKQVNANNCDPNIINTLKAINAVDKPESKHYNENILTIVLKFNIL